MMIAVSVAASIYFLANPCSHTSHICSAVTLASCHIACPRSCLESSASASSVAWNYSHRNRTNLEASHNFAKRTRQVESRHILTLRDRPSQTAHMAFIEMSDMSPGAPPRPPSHQPTSTRLSDIRRNEIEVVASHAIMSPVFMSCRSSHRTRGVARLSCSSPSGATGPSLSCSSAALDANSAVSALRRSGALVSAQIRHILSHIIA